MQCWRKSGLLIGQSRLLETTEINSEGTIIARRVPGQTGTVPNQAGEGIGFVCVPFSPSLVLYSGSSINEGGI